MAILLYLARHTFAGMWFSVFYDKGIMAEREAAGGKIVVGRIPRDRENKQLAWIP
jgi:hypothetical protein